MKFSLFRYIFLLPMLLAVACSDDMIRPEQTEERVAVFNVRVPRYDNVNMRTRADGEDDEKVDCFAVLVSDTSEGDGVLVMDPVKIPDPQIDETGEFRFNVQLDKSISNPRNCHFTLIANPSDKVWTFRKGTTLNSDISATIVDITDAVTGTIMMSGHCNHSHLFEHTGYELSLYRNVAAVSVTQEDNDTSIPFTVYGTPGNVSVTAGINTTLPSPGAGEPAKSVTVADGNLQYIAPVANDSHDDPFSCDAKPFVIVKATYFYHDYYYKLPFAYTDSVGTEKALDIEPNHKYEFLIKDITAPGYDTESEAATGIASVDVVYTIYDRQPRIFNMTSDGRNELGITDKIEDAVGEQCKKSFFVKCYPAPSSATELTFSASGSWISVNPNPLSASEVEDYEGQKGMLYEFEMTIDRNPYRQERQLTLTASWKGLSVKMPVIQGRSFSADTRSSVNLFIYEEDGTLARRINGYWTFVSGIGTEKDYGVADWVAGAPVLHGITPEANGGRIRTQGLHFPVMNGGRYYEYDIKPDFTTAPTAAYYEISVKSGSPFLGQLIYPAGRQALGSIARIQFTGDSYDTYTDTDALRFIAYNADGEMVDNITMDLYHTGLFDRSDHTAFRADVINSAEITAAWYYYEVIRFDSGENVTYWLDRNVGARSCGFDIVDNEGHSIFTEDEAWPFLGGDGAALGGLYYGIADEGVNYGDPSLKNNFGPKGYTIPLLSQWNELRDSRNFETGATLSPSHKAYYSSYLRTDDRAVYFPKAGLMQNKVYTSDSRTGNYWTATAATGFEKVEIGKWLTTIVISGNGTYTSNARIQNPQTALSARLVNVSDRRETYYQTTLQVKGATHVFLYRDINGYREWPTAWPGTPVASPDIAFSKTVNFAYESSRNVKYKVLFNYVDENGGITTMALSNPEAGISATGWDAEGNFTFNTDHELVP